MSDIRFLADLHDNRSEEDMDTETCQDPNYTEGIELNRPLTKIQNEVTDYICDSCKESSTLKTKMCKHMTTMHYVDKNADTEIHGDYNSGKNDINDVSINSTEKDESEEESEDESNELITIRGYGKSEGEELYNGYTIKSDDPKALKAVEQLKMLWHKDWERIIGSTKVKVSKVSKIVGGVNLVVSVKTNNSDDKGSVKVTLYNKGTILCTKQKNEDRKYIKIMTMNVIKPMMNSLMQATPLDEICKETSIKIGCPSCNRRFKRKTNMMIHLKKIHNEDVDDSKKKKVEEQLKNIKPEDIISCDFCDHKVHSKSQMKNHMKEHRERSDSILPPPKKLNRNDQDERPIIDVTMEEEAAIVDHKEEMAPVSSNECINSNIESIDMEKFMVIIKAAVKAEISEYNDNRNKHIPNASKEENIYQRDNIATNISNIKELPANVKMESDNVVYIIPGKGPCGVSAVAAGVFGDEQKGLDLRRALNDYIIMHHEYYKNKGFYADADQPFKRKVGSAENEKNVTIMNNDDLLKWLKSDESQYMWTEGSDLAALSDMLDIDIEVIKVFKDEERMPISAVIKPGHSDASPQKRSVVTLLNYDQTHFDLITGRQSHLALNSSPSLRFKKILGKSSDEDMSEKDKEIKKLKAELKKYKRDRELIETQFKDMEESLLDKSEELNKIRITDEKEEELKTFTNDKYDASSDDDELYQQFNCLDCSFQSENQRRLKKHISLEHRSLAPSNTDTTFNCKDCEECFGKKWQLMNHRAKKHPSNIDCRYHLEDKCVYGDRCAYMHRDQADIVVTCNICEKDFRSKGAMMVHRKDEHSNMIKPCRDYFKSYCSHGEACWYQHTVKELGSAIIAERRKTKTTSQQVFQNSKSAQVKK